MQSLDKLNKLKNKPLIYINSRSVPYSLNELIKGDPLQIIHQYKQVVVILEGCMHFGEEGAFQFGIHFLFIM